MTNENETETELKTPKSIALATKFISMMENRAKRSSDAASNHELVSKLTFMLVLALSYNEWGERVFTVISGLI